MPAYGAGCAYARLATKKDMHVPAGASSPRGTRHEHAKARRPTAAPTLTMPAEDLTARQWCTLSAEEAEDLPCRPSLASAPTPLTLECTGSELFSPARVLMSYVVARKGTVRVHVLSCIIQVRIYMHVCDL